MEKVVAVESSKDGIVRSYGEGVLIGRYVPDMQPFRDHMIPNPCIKLDTGKIVWGFQCWWGAADRMNELLSDAKEIQIVEVEEEIPIFEPETI